VVRTRWEQHGNTHLQEVDRGLKRYDGSVTTIVIEIEYVIPAIAGSATPSVQMIIAFAVSIGLSVGGICGAGSVPGSQHQHCNAVDLFGSNLLSKFQTMLSAARSRTIPCSELIGPGGSGKGRIATASGGWVLHEYTGPNSHQGHIHASGSPLM
jgi:hypothetical protein